ncbi:MAG: AI-2E family transporter [Rhodomicrobium sp.]
MERASRSGAQPATMGGLVAGVATISILYFGRAIFVPLALAILLSFVLHPAALLLRRLRFGRVLSVLTVIFLATCLVVGLGVVVTRQLSGLAGSLPRYEETLSQKIKGLQTAGSASSALRRASDTLQNLGHEIAQGENKQDSQGRLAPNAAKPIQVEIHQPEWAFLDRYRSVMESLSEPLSMAALVLVYLIFIMLQREDLRDRFIRLMGVRSVQRSTAAMDDAGSRLSRYFLTQTLVNSIFGCFIGCGLALIGVPNAVLFGALAAMMRFVPFIGSYIAAAIPLILAAAIEPGWASFFWTLALYVSGETFVGQVIEPWLYGHTTGLSPFAVIVSASFWTWLWGPVGLVMAVPLTVCFVVLASHVERFEFLYILLTDAPALTPQQSFYQRILAGNADEAVHDAEQYLKANSLCQYYSEVAIPGLALAHQDWERGVLDKHQLLELSEAVEELVEDLDDYDDAIPKRQKNSKDPDRVDAPPLDIAVVEPERLPPDWKTSPVLAIGGRTPVDAGGAAIVAQLLRKHGIPAHAPASGMAGRDFLKDVGRSDAPLICVSVFGRSNAQAHIRFIARRLRKSRPDAKILFCCWDEGSDAAVFDLAGFPGFASTLYDALAFVLDSAESGNKLHRLTPGKGRSTEATV